MKINNSCTIQLKMEKAENGLTVKSMKMIKKLGQQKDKFLGNTFSMKNL